MKIDLGDIVTAKYTYLQDDVNLFRPVAFASKARAENKFS